MKFKDIKNLNDFIEFMTIGGVPERAECDCDDMTGFLCHLHDIEMKNANVANKY
jgi:hypothetical protein